MTTSTPKLGLVKANDTDDVDYEAHIGDGFDQIDLLLPTFVCTSGTRPGTPFAGMLIHETDTKHVLQYDGTRWIAYYGVYADSATRDSQVPSPRAGLIVWRTDLLSFQHYDGTAWKSLYTGGSSDTGYVTSNTGFTAATNWSLGGTCRYRVRNGEVELYFEADRNATAITVGTSGDITNTDILSAIPTAIRPANVKYWYSAGTGRLAHGSIGSSGVVTVAAVGGSSNVASETISGFAKYFLD